MTIKLKKNLWVIVLGIALLLVLIPQILSRSDRLFGTKQAGIYFVQPQSQLYVTNPFPLEVHIKSPRVAINAVELRLKYNPSVLEVIDMSSDQSFCSFYVDNTFDNIKGEVRITCGKPNPGFTGESILVRLKMRGKTVSPTTISVEGGTRVLANDGKGTDILHSSPSVSLTIKSSF